MIIQISPAAPGQGGGLNVRHRDGKHDDVEYHCGSVDDVLCSVEQILLLDELADRLCDAERRRLELITGDDDKLADLLLQRIAQTNPKIG